MTLPVALVFHFNQHFSEAAQVASHVGYYGLLNVLRAHRALKFNIHISGTLTDALKWLEPGVLKVIADGVSDGQFELLGSAYAQNVLYASDDWDNARQIALHRQTLADVFGVQPTAFWLPERCWRQTLLPLIADAGYTTTLLEDHILRRAGATAPLVYRTSHDGQSLTLLWDDETFKHKFNFAAWFGRQAQALTYLRQLATQPGADRYCVAYGEDAEAMGLWGWERDVVPNQTWARLDSLLTAIAGEPDIRLIALREAPAVSQTLETVPDGSAAWMDAALKRIDAPYHEDGYSNWFDFNNRSPKLAHFRQTYSIIRGKIQSVSPTNEAVRRLQNAAIHALCAHQYEFGCIGIGGLNYRGWEDARTAVALMRAAQLASDPQEVILIEDCNGDGADEVIICDGRELMITSAYGGRLLYWFDLQTGAQHVGNQMPVIPTEYTGGQAPTLTPLPVRALPTSHLPDGNLIGVEEAAPTRLGRFLPDWIWEGEPASVNLAVASSATAESKMPRWTQTRAFMDEAIVDNGKVEVDPEPWQDSRLEKYGVTFIKYLTDELTIEKTLRFSYGKVTAAYTVRNHDTKPRLLRLRISNELCPDYDEALRVGRDALRFLDGKQLGVLNTATGTAVTVNTSRESQQVELREDFCALTICLNYDFELTSRSEHRFEIKLGRTART